MNPKKKRKNKKDLLFDQKKIDKIEIGIRFKKFRNTINKAQHELAEELNIGQCVISYIELGKCYPNLKYLNHLHKKYRLNINWLITGKGDMFIREECQILVMDSKYFELFKLMQVPDIELFIFGKLAETKMILRDNIDKYMKTA